MALCNLASVFRKKLGTALNTDTDSVDTSSGEWTAEGEPTEVALQVLAMRFGLSKPAIITHEKLQLVAEYPFSSTSKRMSVVYRGEDGTSHIFTKGATDIMMHMTTNSNSMKTLILKQMDALASQGLRVMSFGHRTFPPETAQQFKQENRKDIEQDLEFLGLVGIHDPPRPETASAVRKAQLAGIKVHMYVRSICKSLWPGLVAQLGFHDAKQLLNFLRLEPDAM
jgi:Na+-exporting ATPase